MAQKRLEFPKGFLWGTATAGHQIEGHNMNTDWGKFEMEGKTKDGTKSGVCMDYWNRYDEDHDLMVKLGYQAFRLGIEWAKIEPRDGEFDRAAIDRYHKILQSLRSRGIKICLTLYHWVLPLWFAEGGGWMRPDAVDRFVKYAEVVVKEFAEYPDIWVTLNEPMVPSTAGHLGGEFPPEHKNFKEYGFVTNQLLKAHTRTFELIHKVVSKGPDGGPVKAGVATAYQCIQPYGSGGLAGAYESLLSRIFTIGSFKGWDNAISSGKFSFPFGSGSFPNMKDSYDYCGINYYFRMSLKFDPSKKDRMFADFEAVPPGVETTQMGWQIYPPGFHGVIMDVWKQFKKPIYILENGIADDVDKQRPRYTLEHIRQVQRAITDSADVRGFFHWSFMDNFEWKEGFSKKFGLVDVDHADPKLERKPRPSAYMYSEVIRENAITEDIVDKYAPDAREGVFGNKWMI